MQLDPQDSEELREHIKLIILPELTRIITRLSHDQLPEAFRILTEFVDDHTPRL